jgi:2-oxo-hept-3-ene-1,7-dioate hydratase
MTAISKLEAKAIAVELEAAEKSGVQIGHLSKRFPKMTMDDGYAVQTAWMELKKKAGHKVIGHKIGLTSRAMQRAAGITEPDYGVLMDYMQRWSGDRIETESFIVPRIETELAFRLKSDLEGPNCNYLDVLSATEWVVPALELIDARIEIFDEKTGDKRKVLDTISDNAANGAIIMGGNPVRPDTVDLTRVAATIHRNEVIEDSGVAAAVLGHPATGVAWLANKLSKHGEKLKAGQIVLGGSFTAPIAARKGDSFYADYGPLGVIALTFV